MTHDEKKIERMAAQALVYLLCELYDAHKMTDAGLEWFYEKAAPYETPPEVSGLLFGDQSSWREGIPFVVQVGDSLAAGLYVTDEGEESYPLGPDIHELLGGCEVTQPALATPVRKRGRMYPYPPVDLSHLPLKWNSIDPADVPDGVTMLPSVTNALDVLDKPALKGWYAEQALRSAHQAGIDADLEAFIQRHKWAANKARDARAEQGTSAHTVAERLTVDAPLPHDLSEADEAYADAFMAFWSDHDPDVLYVEQTVSNPQVGYAGTADLFAGLKLADGDPVVIDYKTRAGGPDDKKIAKYGLLYETNILQLAALAEASHRYVPDGDGWTVEPLEYVSHGMGVVLFEDGQYRTQVVGPAQINNAFEAFRACVQLWNWKKGLA